MRHGLILERSQDMNQRIDSPDRRKRHVLALSAHKSLHIDKLDGRIRRLFRAKLRSEEVYAGIGNLNDPDIGLQASAAAMAGRGLSMREDIKDGCLAHRRQPDDSSFHIKR